jgi:hypothetical protein
MKPLAQSMMLPLRSSRYAMLLVRVSATFMYNNVLGLKLNQRLDKGKTMVNLLDRAYCATVGPSYSTAPLPMWRLSFQFGQCVVLKLLCRKWAWQWPVRGLCQCQGTDIRAGPKELNKGSMARDLAQRHLNTDIHLHPINSGPRSPTPP